MGERAASTHSLNVLAGDGAGGRRGPGRWKGVKWRGLTRCGGVDKKRKWPGGGGEGLLVESNAGKKT